MSYINPYMLAALAAAAIPVILHLLNLQKVEKIEFSSIMLLKEIRKSRFRKLRIKQFLLMLVRLLAIVFLVLAFADPYIKNIQGKGSDVKRTGLIFLDSSYSMNAAQDTGKLISDAGKIAGNIEGLFSSSDKVIKVITSVPSGDTASVLKTIYRPDLNSLLRTADMLSPDNPPDEIYVITDLQKVNFTAPPSIKDDRLDKTNFYFVDVSDANLANVSINNVYNDTKIPNAGGRIKLRIAVKNEGAGFVSGIRLKVFASGMLKSEQSLELKPYERKEAALEFVQDESGEIPCYAEISGISGKDDAFSEDNVFKFGLYIPEKIKIGILKGRSSETKYLTSVFDAANSDIRQGIKVYDYSVISSMPDDLNYDVLFIGGYELKSADEKNRLIKFVSDGKGVFLFPSDDYKGGLMESFGSVSIGNKVISGAALKLTDIKTYEPVFEGMFRGNKEGYISVPPVKTKAYFPLIPAGGSYPVISSEDRKPFIILDRSNYGPVLVSAVSADESMSDFPENEIFAPVVLRSSVFLSYQGLAFAKQRDIQNHDTLESVTEKADNAFLGGVLKNYGIKNYEVVEKNGIKNLESLVGEKRKGKSLWMFAAVVVLLLLLSEILLIRKVYGRKE